MNRTELVLAVDEAHLHTTRARMLRYDQGEPILVRILRTGRKHGLAVVIIEQTPSEMPPAVLSNVASRIVFRLTNEQCVRAIAATMGLEETQEDALVELPRRRAIVQTADNPEPFMIQVAEIPERYRPPEEELRERERQSLAELGYEMPETDAAEVLFGKKEEPEFRVKAIRGDLHKVLTRICERPAETIEDRCEALEMERAKEYRARQQLERLGMIGRGDKVGAKLQLHVPTTKGREWAASLGLKVPEFKSGVGHELMTVKVREALEKFFEGIEFFDPGKGLAIVGVQPDLLAGMHGHGMDSGWRMAVQISSTNKSAYEVDRAIQLAELGQIDLVVVVAGNKGSRKGIERKLKESMEKKGLFWQDEEMHKAGLDQQDGRGNGGAGEGSGGSDGGGRATHFHRRAGRIEIIDFESAMNPAYDWGWVME